MNSKRFLIKLQFLGFRYHGVQKQSAHQSIQGRIESLLSAYFKDESFSTKFASRTDAMVSAEETYFLLMFKSEMEKVEVEKALLRLPADIQILEIKAVDDNFVMLNKIGTKEYHYFFSFGVYRPHVFAAPLMTILSEELDIELMQEGAKIFQGTHCFKNYCFKPRPSLTYEREIEFCEIVENDMMTASFFPSKSYIFKISAHGFMRGQVRLMMGALFRVGKGEMSLSKLKKSLEDEDPSFVKWMVPASGLILHKSTLRLHE